MRFVRFRGAVNRTREFSRSTRRSGGGKLALAEFVEADGGDDDSADDDLLPIWIDSQKIAAVGKQADDECAHECADDAAFAANQASASDDDSGDRLEFITLPGGGLAGHQARGLNHAREAGERAGNRIYRRQMKLD